LGSIDVKASKRPKFGNDVVVVLTSITALPSPASHLHWPEEQLLQFHKASIGHFSNLAAIPNELE
jgi:hypothetical protein